MIAMAVNQRSALANSGVGLKEVKNSLGLVCTQVIGNNVDLATGRLTRHDLCKEIDELDAGVTSAGFSQHLSALSVQITVETKRSIAVVREAKPFGPGGRNRAKRVPSIHHF